jgi:hypothetical protein
MKISIAPFEARHEAAAIAFNERMRQANAPTDFLLPESISQPVGTGGATAVQYVAIDATGALRGGIICCQYPAVLDGEIQSAINIQSPLSEGIVDRAYGLVGPQLFQFALRQTPYVFAVGMGSETKPLPRMLLAMGWRVRKIPFYFRMLRLNRCARELAPLRSTPLRAVAGALAAWTGAAAVAGILAHRASPQVRRLAGGFSIEPITNWNAWADDAWKTFAAGLSFGVVRDQHVLPFFYPFTGRSPRVWVLKRDGKALGWFALLLSQMRNNSYFGNLTVATLTDCVGTPEALQAGPFIAAQIATQLGADLLITNQTHAGLQQACLAAGWRGGPSNYLLATSKALSSKLIDDSAYVTRRDGDGLTNLYGEGSPA